MTTLWFCGIAIAFFRVRTVRRKRGSKLVSTSQIIDATDMLGVLLLSGLSTAQAFQQLYQYVDKPTRTVLHDCSQLLTHGARFQDVIRQLHVTLGHSAFALCEALLASERDGLAVGPMLERLSTVSRQQRRQPLPRRSGRAGPVAGGKHRWPRRIHHLQPGCFNQPEPGDLGDRLA